MSEMNPLYQEMIMDHNKKPRNYGSLAHANHSAQGHNPLCGDFIMLGVKVEADRIKEIAFQGESCAICKASASMMTTEVKTKTISEAETLVQEFRDMAMGKLDIDKQSHHLGKLRVFAGVKDLPSRVKCAVLPWHTLHAAFQNVSEVSTEGEHEVSPL